MSSFEFKIDIEKTEYEDYLKDHPLCNLLQTTAWGEVKKDSEGHLCGLYKNGILSGCALILVKSGRLSQRIVYSPRGFMLDYNNKELLTAFCSGVKDYAVKIGAYAVKIDPNILRRELNKDGTEKVGGFNNEHIIKALEEQGFIHAGFGLKVNDYLQPRFQMCVPLVNKDKIPLNDAELLKSYDKKARKFIGRYIEERGYTFEKHETPEIIPEFSRLVDITAKRQKIILRNENYFKSIYNAFSKTDDITFYFAKLHFKKLLDFTKKELVSKGASGEEADRLKNEINQIENYIKQYGETVYTAALMVLRTPKKSNGRGATAELLYSGCDESFFPRFRPTLELRYYAMTDCRDKGCDYFDLGGVKGTLDGGLADFKKKFNPDILEFIGEFNMILKPRTFDVIENKLPKLRKKYRKLKRKLSGK